MISRFSSAEITYDKADKFRRQLGSRWLTRTQDMQGLRTRRDILMDRIIGF